MARQPDKPIPIDDRYRIMLRDAVYKAGRLDVVKATGLNQSSIHRAVNEGALTFTLAEQLRDGLAALGVSVPPAVEPIIDVDHHEWYKVGTELFEKFPETFAMVLQYAKRELAMAKVIGDRNSAIASALPEGD